MEGMVKNNFWEGKRVLVTGATAVQIGTASFYDPTLANRLVDQLASVVESQGCQRVTELIGTLQLPDRSGCPK